MLVQADQVLLLRFHYPALLFLPAFAFPSFRPPHGAHAYLEVDERCREHADAPEKDIL